MLTTTLLSTTNVLLANTKIEKNKYSFKDESLIANNYFDIDDSDTLKITVTGTRTERTVYDFPGSVKVYSFEELDATTSSNWRELFKNDAGLGSQDFIRSDYSRDYAKGDSGNINIRGLEGNRVLTQIDGITLPRFSYGKSTFSVSRLNFIEFSNLGKIEVLKGSGSALYGSDALGGVVTLKSLSPDDLLKDNQNSIFKFSGGYKSANSSVKPNLKYAFRDGDIEGIFSITHESFEELDRKAPRIYIDDKNGSNNSYYSKFVKKLGSNQQMSITLENVDKSSTKDTNTNNIDSFAYSYLKTSSKDITDSRNTRANFEYKFKSEQDSLIDNFKSNIYINDQNYTNLWSYTGYNAYGANDSEDQTTTLDTRTYGINLQFSNNIAGEKYDQKLTYGFEGSLFNGDRVAKDVVVVGSGAGGTYRRNPETDITKIGFYVQDEITRGNWDIIAGLRYDNINLDAKSSKAWYDSGSVHFNDDDARKNAVGEPHDIQDDNISPNLSLMYRLNQNTNVYGKYSKGFRTPSWEELNSSHINIVKRSPFSPWSSYSTVGNPDLKSETSNNYEIGLKSVNEKFDFAIAGFYQTFNNFLEQSVRDGSTTLTGVDTSIAPSGEMSSTIYRTKNVADANLWGLEFNGTYYFDEKGSGLSFGNSIALQVGENETDDQPLKTINPFTIVSNLKYIFPNKKFVANLANTYTGVPRVTNDYKTDDYGYVPDAYFVTDLQLGYKINKDFSANIGIYNLFDSTYYKWSDLRSNGGDGTDDQYYYRYAQPGRSIQAGFSWRF